MTLNIEHPLGLAPPAHWEGLSHIPVTELVDWLASGPKASKPKGGKRNSHHGMRLDLGHSCRSTMEANWERYLRYHGYQQWLDKGAPPGGKWYRYEGRRFEFPQKTANGKYVTDYEVWPGLFEPRPYECHEVKGWLDPDSKTKLHRMDKYFPDIPVVLVTAQVFKEQTRSVRNLIPNWEG